MRRGEVTPGALARVSRRSTLWRNRAFNDERETGFAEVDMPVLVLARVVSGSPRSGEDWSLVACGRFLGWTWTNNLR